MRRLKHILLVLLLATGITSKAQTGLDIQDSLSFYSTDTLVSGNYLYFNITTENTSTDTITDFIKYYTAIDTNGTSGANTDTIYSYTTSMVSLLPGSTLQYYDSLVFTINQNCRGGINTVVIWPVAYTTNNQTVDSFKFDLYVIEPLGIGKNKQKETLVVSPNPFSSKIYLISPSGIMPEQVRITDINGRTVYENNTLKNPFIETSELVQGVYFIEMFFPDGSRQIIKAIKE